MKLLGVGIALALMVGLVAVARAESLDLKQVPADAKWLGHVDVDAMRTSIVVQKAWAKGMEMHKDAAAHLAKLRDKLGLDICKDLHGLTFYGKQVGKHTGVLIVNAKVNQKLLLEKAAKAPDHKVTKFGSYDLHTWTDKHHGPAHTVAGTFYKGDRLVFASSLDELKAALNVLDGKSPSVGSNSPLAGKVRPGTTFLLRVSGLAEANLPCKAPVVKQIESAHISVGESGGQSFLHARATMKTTEVTQQVKAIVDGGKALAAMHVANDAAAKKLVDALQVTAEGTTLNVRWTGSANDVWNLLEKHAKRMAELHGKMDGPWQQRFGGPAAPMGPGAKPGCKPGPGCKQAPGCKPGTCMHDRWAHRLAIIKSLDLTDAQKAKAKELRKLYGPKFKETLKKFGDILTADQKKARDEAVKSAHAAGKHGKAAFEAVKAAVKLTDAQKAKFAELRKQMQSLRKEVREKFLAILTPEQQAKLKKAHEAKKPTQPAGK